MQPVNKHLGANLDRVELDESVGLTPEIHHEPFFPNKAEMCAGSCFLYKGLHLTELLRSKVLQRDLSANQPSSLLLMDDDSII